MIVRVRRGRRSGIRASTDCAQPWRFSCELPPVEEDHRFAGGQFLGYLTNRCQGGRWQPVEQVIGDGFPVPVSHLRPRGRLPGRSRRLPGLPGPGQRGRGRRGLVRRCGAGRQLRAAARWRWWRPSADRSAGWGRRCLSSPAWVKASWISWKNSGSRDGATVATAWRRAGSDRAGMGISGSSPCGSSAVIQPASSHVQQQNKPCHAAGAGSGYPLARTLAERSR